jgi:hypothetical protein
MKVIILNFAAAVVLAGLAATASAQGNIKSRNYEKYAPYDRYEYDRDWRDAPFFRLFPGYQARNPDRFPQGSDAWWRAMDREGRGGFSRGQ